MRWLQIYVPWGRLDGGLIALLIVWLAVVGLSFVLARPRRESDE